MPIWSEILAELAGRQPPDFDGIRRKYLVELHGHTGRNVILYASGWLQRAHRPGWYRSVTRTCRRSWKSARGSKAIALT